MGTVTTSAWAVRGWQRRAIHNCGDCAHMLSLPVTVAANDPVDSKDGASAARPLAATSNVPRALTSTAGGLRGCNRGRHDHIAQIFRPLPQVDTKYVIEAANGPTTPEGDNVLRERGITVLPDIYTNGGGVTVSFFEWVQVRRMQDAA